MSIIQELLTEKLRPKNFNQVILTNRIKKLFPNGKISQNVLLYGTAGLGKTSIAKVLAKGHDTLYINISSERGIDTVREKITEFCSTKSLMDNDSDYKVVILDEMDGGTDLLFKALRATMEKFTDTRFLATCNYINKIPEPIQSRFSLINFNPIDKKEEEELLELYTARVKKVCEKIKLNWESEELIEVFVKRNFPDLRKVFSVIQDLKTANDEEVITEDKILRAQYLFTEIYECILNKNNEPRKNYELIMRNYQGKSDEIFGSLANEFPEWVFENHTKYETAVGGLINIIAEWDYKRKFLVDDNLGILACIFQCQNYLRTM